MLNDLSDRFFSKLDKVTIFVAAEETMTWKIVINFLQLICRKLVWKKSASLKHIHKQFNPLIQNRIILTFNNLEHDKKLIKLAHFIQAIIILIHC